MGHRENLILTAIRSTDRPFRSESLYRLCYPGTLQLLFHSWEGLGTLLVMVRCHGIAHGSRTSCVDWNSLLLCTLQYDWTHVYIFFTVDNIMVNNSQPLICNESEISCVCVFIDSQFTLQETQGQQNIRMCILMQSRPTYDLVSHAIS